MWSVLPGIMHRAVMIVVAGRAVGELRHLQRAEPDRAGVLQALQRGRGRRRRRNRGGSASRRSRPCRRRNTCPCAPAARHAAARSVLPLASAASASSAAFSALSASIAMKALSFGCHCAMRCRQERVTSCEDTCLVGDRLGDRGQRHQCGLGAHRDTFAVCASRKLAGSRSNGNVPAIGAKPSKAGPIELAIRVGDFGVDGHARGLGDRLHFLRIWSGHAAFTPSIFWRAAVPGAGNGHVARRLMAHCIERGEFWRGFCAERLREWTTGVKPAARRRIDRVGRIARDRRHLGAAVGIGGRHRREQRPRIGMRRMVPDLVDRAELDDLAEIHHQHAVGDVAHDVEIVADEEIGQAEFALEIDEQVRAPAPRRICRARRPPHRGSPAAATARARARC